jgi:mannitol-specific phosphotransferase system IIBC component
MKHPRILIATVFLGFLVSFAMSGHILSARETEAEHGLTLTAIRPDNENEDSDIQSDEQRQSRERLKKLREKNKERIRKLRERLSETRHRSLSGSTQT